MKNKIQTVKKTLIKDNSKINREKKWERLQNIGVSNHFLNKIPVALDIEPAIVNCGFLNIKVSV